MDIKQFNQLKNEDRQYVLDEMCELYSLIEKYPTNIEDLRIFIKWNQYIGNHGNKLYEFLNGIIPSQAINEDINIETVRNWSNEVFKSVKFWNNWINWNKN